MQDLLPGLLSDVRQCIENQQKALARNPSHARNSRLKWLLVDSLLKCEDYDKLCVFLAHLMEVDR